MSARQIGGGALRLRFPHVGLPAVLAQAQAHPGVLSLLGRPSARPTWLSTLLPLPPPARYLFRLADAMRRFSVQDEELFALEVRPWPGGACVHSCRRLLHY